MTTDQRLIEDYIPIEAISAEARREKSIRKGHISTLHLWWARRPLVAARAAVYGALVPAPADKQAARVAEEFVAGLCTYPGPPDLVAQARRHILEAHADRLTTETGHLVTAEDIEAGRAPRPRVLDMFAGGGAIPLEALRLGCEAYALDLNPVAHIIQLCTLVYPQQFGAPDPAARGSARDGTWAGLAAEVEHWGKWVLERVKAEIGDLYPPIPDPDYQPSGQLSMDLPVAGKQAGKGMLTPVAYLWTRTVRCKNPACGGTVPLARQTWLAKKEGRFVALRADAETNRHKEWPDKTVRYHVVEAKTEADLGFDPAGGSKTGNAACLFCGTVADSTYVKAEGQAGRIGMDLMAIVCTSSDKKGKEFIHPDLHTRNLHPDEPVIWDRILSLSVVPDGSSVSHLTVPDEKIVSDAKGSAWIVQYGYGRFGDLYSMRQLLSMLTFVKEIHNAHAEMLRKGYTTEQIKSLIAYMGLLVGRLADYSSTLCTWESHGELIGHTFTRQALPMVWDFAEVNPLGDASGNASSALEWIVQVIRSVSNIRPAGRVYRGTAADLPFDSQHFDAIVSDPPYYDNVAYADLSDFFYVWLKRSIGFLFPEHFTSMLTPKKSEAVADATRHDGDRQLAGQVYEQMMARAFAEAGRVLKPDAPLVIVYAHKTTLGWSTLVDALRTAGFTVTEAWPLDTERGARIRAIETASLASSIFLVARRQKRTEIGSYEHDVRPNLQSIVRERIERLWSQGVTGADLVIACVGAGLRAFTRFARVEYANGEEVPANSFLAEVEGAVLEALLEKLFGVSQAGVSSVDPATRFYVLWRYAYRQAAIDGGEAIVFAYPQHVELDGPGSLSHGGNPLVEKEKGKYRLRDFDERGADEKLGLPHNGQPAALIDVLHRLLWLVEHRPGQISAYLDETQPDLERLRIIAQTLAGQALAGNGSGGGKSLVASRGAEAAALRKLTGNWRTLIDAQRGGLV